MEVQPLNPASNPAFSSHNHDAFWVSDPSDQPPDSRKLTPRKMAADVGAPVTPTDSPSSRCPSTAAKDVQKAYRSYRIRRMLADSAVVAEELWWQALDFARLNHSTISFFDFLNPETAASRWSRVGLNASRVGKGLSKDAKAQKLAFQHWIEAVDPRHRYGHNLHLYYDEWCKSTSGQPFFYWLDLGDGKELELIACPRSKLRQQCIKYLGPQEREHHEYTIDGGKILNKQTRKPLDTKEGSKWIFVMSTSKRLYAGQKKKGSFQHSSFLAGGATLAAGRLEAENGKLKSISPYSGHYKPTDESLDSFLGFLKESGVNLDKVEIKKTSEDYEVSENEKLSENLSALEVPFPSVEEKVPSPKNTEYSRTLSGGLRSPKTDVPKTVILQRINSKNAAKSYQLGHQVSAKWSTGAGPRIGCVADYPLELRLQALELTNLSPRFFPSFSSPTQLAAIVPPSTLSPSATLMTTTT